jgi:mannose-6-phosphate isomerase-like protein (cupin superfamily)
MAAVPFVNCFEVPEGREDDFLAFWREVNDYMAAKPGYVSHRLHRSLAPDAKFRFVNYAEWETAEHWRAAHDEGFRQLVSRLEWAEFSSTHALYDIVHTGHARETVTRAPVVIRAGDGTTLNGRPSTVTIKVGEEHGAAFSVAVFEAAAGFRAPPELHSHTREDWAAYVLSGEVAVATNEREIRAGRGDVVLFRRGTRFAWSNPGEQPARFLAIYAPAGFEQFFADLGDAVRDQPDAIGDPAAMGRIVRPLWERYGIR